ncbi:hypothetical protein ACUXNS_002675 [Brevibacterium pityocampae]
MTAPAAIVPAGAPLPRAAVLRRLAGAGLGCAGLGNLHRPMDDAAAHAVLQAA